MDYLYAIGLATCSFLAPATPGVVQEGPEPFVFGCGCEATSGDPVMRTSFVVRNIAVDLLSALCVDGSTLADTDGNTLTTGCSEILGETCVFLGTITIDFEINGSILDTNVVSIDTERPCGAAAIVFLDFTSTLFPTDGSLPIDPVTGEPIMTVGSIGFKCDKCKATAG